LWIIVGNRELKEVDYFKCLVSMLIRDGYCTREIKMRIAIAKEASNNKIKILNMERNWLGVTSGEL
jgi:hypothetical protein